MWSDVVQHAERLHLLRVCLWGALTTLAGTLLLVIAYRQPGGSALIRRFGLVCALCGAIELLIAGISYPVVPLRNISGATRLDRLAWMQLGLYIGLAGMGITVAMAARLTKPRTLEPSSTLAAFGAGAAIALHGLALATLELLLIADISR